MEIIFENYDWKFIGISKETSSKKEIEVFPRIAAPVIKNLMEQLAWYNAEDSEEFRTSKNCLEIKSDLQKKIKQVQEKQLIKINALSILTNIPEKKLLNFITDVESEDFNTGELFSLSSILDRLSMID